MKPVVFVLLLSLMACGDPPALVSGARMKISPNPAVHSAHVKVIDPVYPFTISVFDPNGKYMTGAVVTSSADLFATDFGFTMPDFAGRYAVILEMDGKVFTEDVIRP